MQSKKSIREPTMEWHSAYAPRISFLHPLLIGSLRAWNAHLDRAVELYESLPDTEEKASALLELARVHMLNFELEPTVAASK